MRRRWLFAILLVGVLAIGITGGAVLAQEDGTSGDSTFKSFVSRVAAILGLDETQVQDAFEQAASEMEDEALQRKLDRLVELGRLTQEQADEYGLWYQSRPEGLLPGTRFRGFRGGHGFFRGFGEGQGFFSGSKLGGHGWFGKGFHRGVAPTPTPESSGETSL